MSYWYDHPLEDMNHWNDWEYTDRYIELWKPKKVIL